MIASSAAHPSGYFLVTLLVGLESMGIPVPGEAAMVGAAIYAATTGQMSIAGVIAAAAFGAVVGGMAGYGIGRHWGPGLLATYGPRVGLTAQRQKVGRYLFARHGNKIMCLGRFFSIARTFCAVLAGVNLMPARPFLLWNLIGGVAWPTAHCLIAYGFGSAAGPLSTMAWVALALIAIIWILLAIRVAGRHETYLSDLADRYDQR